jgi:hypothetical protein
MAMVLWAITMGPRVEAATARDKRHNDVRKQGAEVKRAGHRMAKTIRDEWAVSAMEGGVNLHGRQAYI